MIKRMTAKFNGRDAITGAPIRKGDDIQYCTDTRRAWLAEHDDALHDDQGAYITPQRYRSDIFQLNGREYYRNKAGRCIDAPCCGCCTI
jgi:hypothetical protein